jgi:hypothetical protein
LHDDEGGIAEMPNAVRLHRHGEMTLRHDTHPAARRADHNVSRCVAA